VSRPLDIILHVGMGKTGTSSIQYFLRGQLFHMLRTRNTTTEQHLDPARLDHFLALAEIPEELHAPLRVLAERGRKPGSAP